MTEISHGTYSGYQAHRRRGLPACDACREACRIYMADLRARSATVSDHDRLMNRVRSRALWRLKDLYPAKFAALVADELRAEKIGPGQ